jgi:hypothetical protein
MWSSGSNSGGRIVHRFLSRTVELFVVRGASQNPLLPEGQLESAQNKYRINRLLVGPGDMSWHAAVLEICPCDLS